MTQQLANSIKSLALDNYNAIKVIAGERECGECMGIGDYRASHKIDSTGHFEICSKCNGTGKVGYVWKPEVGEWCVYGKYAELISAEDVENHNCIHLFHVWANVADCIPILSWETIEQILEGYTDYFLLFLVWYGYAKKHTALIYSDRNNKKFNEHIETQANSRQEAVMLAVIKLGKELKCRQKK